VKGVTSKVMGTVKWKAGSSWEGPGGVQAVAGTVGSFGRASWWAVRQNSL